MCERWWRLWGYEAMIIVETGDVNGSKIPLSNAGGHCGLNNASGTITFLQDLSQIDVNHGRPLTSCIFSIHEKDELLKHVVGKENRSAQRASEVVKETTQLNKEVAEYGDVLLLDQVDVYRNLPGKMLLFYKWAADSTDFSFLLKTDDDCYLDLLAILEGLSKTASKNTWWSSFRVNHAVERYGKWAERHYSASVYPPFGCGSGSVLSRDLVTWLARNADHLKAYQGEDVSLGIWLAALGPNIIQDTRWQCSAVCGNNMLSHPELSTDELRQLWTNKLLCSKPCGCDEE